MQKYPDCFSEQKNLFYLCICVDIKNVYQFFSGENLENATRRTRHLIRPRIGQSPSLPSRIDIVPFPPPLPALRASPYTTRQPPHPPIRTRSPSPPPPPIATALLEMGFSLQHIRRALSETGMVCKHLSLLVSVVI